LDRKCETKTAAPADRAYYDSLERYLAQSPGSLTEKLQNFPKYAPRQYLTRFLSRYEMFKRVLSVQGSIVECGVFLGGGLMTFAQLSAIFEPVNHQRRIIGFDTFSGFPCLHENDRGSGSEHGHPGGMASHAYEDLQEAIRLFDRNRFLAHIPKVELVSGDAVVEIPRYVANNRHLLVSLLYLDFDIYEPTRVALEQFVPRMPRGALIAFDELNNDIWPGETVALLDTLGVHNLRIERFAFDSLVSYAVLD
jgi:hypothetical protein